MSPFSRKPIVPILFSESILLLVLYFAILMILIGIAVFATQSLRANSLQKEPTTEEHLNYFRDLNSEGKLSEEEFRIIKRQLSSQIVSEEKGGMRRTTFAYQEPYVSPAATLSRGRRNVKGTAGDDVEFFEYSEDTKLSAGGSSGEPDETVTGR